MVVERRVSHWQQLWAASVFKYERPGKTVNGSEN